MGIEPLCSTHSNNIIVIIIAIISKYVTIRILYLKAKNHILSLSGLTNGPALFQYLMDKCLHGLLDETCAPYLDDTIVYSEDFDSHVMNIHSLLRKYIELNGFKNLCFYNVLNVA